jgi:hypothetical protein
MPKAKHKKSEKKKAGKKESQLAIRVEKSERDAFVALCDTLDTSAAREIRRFMRDFVTRHQSAAPSDAAPPQVDEEATAPAPTASRRAVSPRASAQPRETPPEDAPSEETEAAAGPGRRGKAKTEGSAGGKRPRRATEKPAAV